MAPKPLDSSSETVLNFIEALDQAGEIPPTIQEIATGCFFSTGKVVKCLDKLEAYGKLTREPGKARSIRLIRPSKM
jgi:DNA-binding MarR family transcriptional regulator